MKTKWATDKPTKSGWYWAIDDYETDYAIEVVQVVINAYEQYVLSTEHDGRQNLDDWDYWLGPISTPDLPKGFLSQVTIRYWIKNTWPYSIDEKIEGAKLASMKVPKIDTFIEDGKRYYRLQSGIGVYTDLLVEQ